jgi:nucleotide-binding universal stress UspA family protein
VCVREGDPAEELIRAARELDAELMVVGSHGRLELGSALLGSTSRALMTGAPCPVVVVPPEAQLPKRPRTNSIVCGVEGAERDRAVLRFAADMRRRLDGTLHAVHGFDASPGPVGPVAVMPPLLPELSETASARLAAALADAGVDAEERTVLALSPAAALDRVAVKASAALVIVGCHGDGRLASVLQGSVSIRLAATARCPVAVLPPSAELAPGSGHYELLAGAA